MEERVSVELPKDVVTKFRDGCHAKSGKHPWKEIYRIMNHPFEEEVVNWCPLCGSVVIDVETDGRVQPGRVVKIKSPLIANRMSYKGL